MSRKVKSISKRRKPAAKPTLYRVMVSGTRINAIKAMRVDVNQVYEIPANRVQDAAHAQREASRLCVREHPAWENLTTTVLA